nr:ribonuclease H-like domain-containing protein [Tanacetum cinerariifolium]
VYEFDLDEMDLKWQVAMISTRLKKFYKNTWRKMHFDAKEPVGFDKRKVECFNCHIKDTLLESADQKRIKTVEGEIQETLDTRQGTMKRDM